MLKIDDAFFNGFKLQKKYNHNLESTGEISSIDYNSNGEWLVSASSHDETIQLYNCINGKHHKTSYSKKYGVNIIKFAHDNIHTVYTSAKENDILRYLDLNTNSYVRYFKGHKSLVTGLDFSASEHSFLSASLDNTVKLWDIRSSNCQGNLVFERSELLSACFDPDTIYFAVVLNQSKVINFYDIRNFDLGPFTSIDLNLLSRPLKPNNYYTNLYITNDKKKLVAETFDGHVYIFDLHSNSLIYSYLAMDFTKYSTSLPNHNRKNYTAPSPDGNYILNLNNTKVEILNLEILKFTRQDIMFPKDLKYHAHLMSFNPKYAHFSLAGKELAFWLHFDKK